MWWEYAIVLIGLAMAAIYVSIVIVRMFQPGGHSCSSGACRSSATGTGAAGSGRVTVTPLVQISKPAAPDDAVTHAVTHAVNSNGSHKTPAKRTAANDTHVA